MISEKLTLSSLEIAASATWSLTPRRHRRNSNCHHPYSARFKQFAPSRRLERSPPMRHTAVIFYRSRGVCHSVCVRKVFVGPDFGHKRITQSHHPRCERTKNQKLLLSPNSAGSVFNYFECLAWFSESWDLSLYRVARVRIVQISPFQVYAPLREDKTRVHIRAATF